MQAIKHMWDTADEIDTSCSVLDEEEEAMLQSVVAHHPMSIPDQRFWHIPCFGPESVLGANRYGWISGSSRSQFREL